jgi:hypothetical protein
MTDNNYSTKLSNVQIAAALADEIYRRGKEDFGIDVERDLGAIFPQGQQGINLGNIGDSNRLFTLDPKIRVGR